VRTRVGRQGTVRVRIWTSTTASGAEREGPLAAVGSTYWRVLICSCAGAQPGLAVAEQARGVLATGRVERAGLPT